MILILAIIFAALVYICILIRELINNIADIRSLLYLLEKGSSNGK